MITEIKTANKRRPEFRVAVNAAMTTGCGGGRISWSSRIPVTMPIALFFSDGSINSEAVLRLLDSCGCTAYDCEFVALAQSLHLPLVTTDKELLRTFAGLAIHPADFH